MNQNDPLQRRAGFNTTKVLVSGCCVLFGLICTYYLIDQYYQPRFENKNVRTYLRQTPEELPERVIKGFGTKALPDLVRAIRRRITITSLCSRLPPVGQNAVAIPIMAELNTALYWLISLHEQQREPVINYLSNHRERFALMTVLSTYDDSQIRSFTNQTTNSFLRECAAVSARQHGKQVGPKKWIL
jgi:hypothetical protein